MCLNNINMFLRLQIDIDIFYQLQLHLTSQTDHQITLGIIRVSFRDRVNHNHNLASTLIITSTNSTPKNSLTQSWPMTSAVTLTGGK